MSEPSTLLQFFAQGAAPVLVALLLGGYLYRRSGKTRSHQQWSIGISLLIASACAGIALLRLYIEVTNTESFGVLMVLVAPSMPIAVIALVTTLSYCTCIIWGSAQDRFVTRMGFVSTSRRGVVVMSAAVLAIAVAAGVYLILPVIHLLPYSALTSEQRSGQKTLTAIRFDGVHEPMILVQAKQWPRHNPAFRLTLDWRGRAVLDVWREGTATQPEETTTYYLPFRQSAYLLDDGMPVAIQQ